jgi:hypothetical protein
MTRRWVLGAGLAGLAGLIGGAIGWRVRHPATLSPADFAVRYATPLVPPDGPLSVYHLGHSLVGHDYASQLGWGASLKNHWDGEVPGFVEENGHPQFQGATEATNYGNYDAVIFTEMVELRDAIRSHDSAKSLANWAAMTRTATPFARLYLYETWHRLDDPAGWLERIDGDLANLWEGELLRPAMARNRVGTIYVIPGGQVLAAAVRRVEDGQVPGLTRREDLFARAADGRTDPIHLNDIGNYVIALTHYATLYHRSPVGLPHDLTRADGTAMTPMPPDAARALQKVVWTVVTRYPPTGVAKE